MKNKFITIFIFTFAFFLCFCSFTNAQTLNTLSTQCEPPNERTYGSIIVQKQNTVFTPCATGSIIFNGAVDFSGATISSITGLSGVTINSGTNTTSIGDTGSIGNGTIFQVLDSTRTFNFTTGNGAGIFNLTAIKTFNINKTISGGTGAATINKPFGTVNFAAGTSAITVTNDISLTTSLVFATARTNDTTCSVKNVVPASGSFVINMTANCTATTSVAFWIVN